jgi:hypothetical protein
VGRETIFKTTIGNESSHENILFIMGLGARTLARQKNIIIKSWVKEGGQVNRVGGFLTCELQVYLSGRRNLSVCRENRL